MSYFDDASLVMIPSGYKTSKVYSVKPTDGTGDLTFTRSNDTATRVGPDGLIEKVRTNLLLQSNTFSTTWTNTNTTETIGQTGYDGTSNAWLLNITGGTDSQHINQSISTSGSATFSVYAKAGTKNWVLLLGTGGTNPRAFFDLQNGVVGTQISSVGKIVSVGNGWYRCSISHTESTGSVRIYVATGDDDIAQASGNILIQAAQLETGDIATDYIATTTAAVSVGPVANVPRLDYLNSSCPRLLLEPQRTNIKTSSENATGWGNPISITTSLNVATSPDGYANADKIIETATTANHRFDVDFSATSGTAYTFSYFAKASERTQCHIHGYSDNGVFSISTAIFNLSNGTIVSNTGGGSASIVNYGNGWYRVSLTLTAGATAIGYWGFGVALNGTTNYLGVATNGALFYGIQLEAGAYATSYIPTLGAAVTRGADAASKTGISSLIGQTEGTIYVEVQRDNSDQDYRVQISDATTNNWLFVGLETGLNIRAYANVGGANQFSAYSVSAVSNATHKIAIAYANNDVKVYVDGISLITITSGSIPATSRLDIGSSSPNNVAVTPSLTSQVLLFKTRLTNSQLAELTA